MEIVAAGAFVALVLGYIAFIGWRFWLIEKWEKENCE